MHNCNTIITHFPMEITLRDKVIHKKARWMRQLARSLREYSRKANRQAADIAICKPQIDQNVLNALIQQGFSLKMKGNLANFRENPRIFKGKREFTLANEGRFWWAVPLEGDEAEGEAIFPVPFIRKPQAD